jgi:hypothetical protein
MGIAMTAVEEVSMPREALLADPHVNWKHIDGPLMIWAGQMHWLTLRERVALSLRMTTVEAIAQKHWPARRYWNSKAREATP